MDDQGSGSSRGRAATAGAILVLGALSMTFAEVLSGSSVLWFVTPWGWLLTFWLYLAHTVLFVNLALRFRRTSLPSMYLWGVLFGLYESWITKVTWAGYAGSSPGWGTVLGFSFPELLIIVFCWHPIFSWLLPVLSFEALGEPGAVLPTHRRLLVRSRRTTALGTGVAVVGALFLALNAHGNAVAVGVTAAGSLAIIGLFHRLATRGGAPLTLDSVRLGRRGMTVLCGYLALLYLASFVLIFPERIAPPLTIALTLGLYGIVGLLLRQSKPDAPDEPGSRAEAASPALVSGRELRRGGLLLTILGVVFAVGLPLAYPFAVLAYLGLVVAGPILMLRAGFAVARPVPRTA
jgi:hypothetical protein